MPAARYWRIVGLRAYGAGDLALSEVQLFDTTGRIDTSATLTSSVSPSSGSLANLKDADTATVCTFARADFTTAGFNLQWDFGAGITKNVLGVRLGSASSKSSFLASAQLQSSVDASNWTTVFGLAEFTYPGANSLTTAPSASDTATLTRLIGLHMDGSVGSAVFPDSAVLPIAQTVSSTGVNISATQSKFGGTSAFFNNGYIWFGAPNSVVPGASDFCIQGFCYDIGSGSRRVLFGNSLPGGAGATLGLLLTTSNRFSATAVVDGTSYNIAPAAVATPINTWYHVAFVRYGTTLTLYLDGTAIGSISVGTGSVAAGGGRFALGSLGEYLINGGESGTQWIGYVDDFQVQIGAPVYTTDFTPPTAPFTSSVGFLSPLSAATAVASHTSEFVSREDISGSPTARYMSTEETVRDIYFAGRGSVTATVKEDGTPTDLPVRRKVRLFRDRDGLMVRETWSDAVTGAYSFTEIAENETYSVVSYDHNNNFRAVIADRITPTVP